MTATAWVLVGLALCAALVDWIAVARGRRIVEYVAKPSTMLVLIAAAVVLDPVDQAMRWWFVAALVCSLVGDVMLMLEVEELFVVGLGAFLLGHVAYIVGFVSGDVSAPAVALGLVALSVLVGPLAPRIVAGARRVDPRLSGPVIAYIVVISAMVVSAVGSMVWVAIVGAVAFYLSDLMIGWSRFVRDLPGSRLVIMVTYHLAQVMLVMSLVLDR